jgi:dihydropteroate synthase
MRVLCLESLEEVKDVMHSIGVDAYGVEIMASKSFIRLLKIDVLSNIAANILKQEMLSLGGDAAIARGSLTGQARKTGCLLMGTPAQFKRLAGKLRAQPFGLSALSPEIERSLENYEKKYFTLKLGRHTLRLGRRTHIMGVLNLTPDSFSADGLYRYGMCATYIADRVVALMRDGADIIDAGGESSRPGSKAVPEKEEIKRVIPVIKILAKSVKVPISIDTCKVGVARQALDSGVSLINDITGLRDPAMAKLAARYKCGVVIMHMKGNPSTMQRKPQYKSVVAEISDYLGTAIRNALEAGISEDKIIIDPGIGFGKTAQHNLQILKGLGDLKSLGRPILVGVSRKSFLGKILDAPAQERLSASTAGAALAALKGAHIIRAHDVKETKEALKVIDAIEK